MRIEDILRFDDAKAVYYLRKRNTPLPDPDALSKEWNPERHEVMDKNIRPDGKTLVKEGWTDDKGVEHEPVYKDEPVNRVPIPLEQDITNVHTAFCVGREPTLRCEPNDETEKELLSILRSVFKKNKLRFQNKRVVRAWFSEQEVAEYWYTVKDDGFWAKTMRAMGKDSGTKAAYRLKSAVWSPLKGDKLYPHFDDNGDFDGLSREYKLKDEDGMEKTYLTCVTASDVITWDLTKGTVRVPEQTFKHGFKKIPVLYMYRKETLCKKIRPVRERLEKLVSNFADCIDMNFFPRLILEGDLENMAPVDIGKSKMIKIENGGKAYYLNWTQTSDAVRLELENNWNMCYQMTSTPRLTLDNLKGLGNVPSGRAFEFLFMGTNLATDNHYETIGEFMQRRCNFLISAIGSLNSDYEKASETIDIDVEMNKFTIDDLAEKIQNAKDASGKPVASQKTGIIMAGIVDDADDELRQLEEENAPALGTLKTENVLTEG
jgi:hypothetical protein